MNNQYVNLSPQKRMAQMLQQQEQQDMQMQQPQIPQQQNPLQSMPSMVQMYMRNKQMQGAIPTAPQGYNPPTGMLYGD
jgi:hypothetical protein